ncbi:MAG: hypothetical protein H6816_07555 [Phycisphaerales bacterium]|nr:hypothetical protein [Phycisphaerales bacterium]
MTNPVDASAQSGDLAGPRGAASADAAPGRLSRWVWGLAAANLAVHLLAAGRYGYFRDELYYLACSRHLAAGYVDHPPLVVWFTWLVVHALGESLLALRLMPAVTMAVVVVLCGWLARALGGGRFARKALAGWLPR